MKILDKEKILKRRMQEQIMREIAIMKKLKHPSIIELRGIGLGFLETDHNRGTS